MTTSEDLRVAARPAVPRLEARDRIAPPDARQRTRRADSYPSWLEESIADARAEERARNRGTRLTVVGTLALASALFFCVIAVPLITRPHATMPAPLPNPFAPAPAPVSSHLGIPLVPPDLVSGAPAHATAMDAGPPESGQSGSKKGRRLAHHALRRNRRIAMKYLPRSRFQKM